MLKSRTSGLILDVANQLGGPMPSVTTLYDHSRFKNNSSAWSGATWVQLPSKIWTLNFDGNDQITIPNTLAYCLNGYQAATCLVWVKRTVIGVGHSYIIRLLNSVANTRYALFSNAGDGKISSVGRSDNEAGNLYSSDFIPLLTEWALFGTTLSLSSNRITVYYNTTSQLSGVLAFTYPYFYNNIGSAYIGSDGTVVYLTGQLAKLRIWTRALSMAEIRSIYDNEKHLFGIGK